MKTTTCAYCDHEVKITPDGVCLYCGGNLAEEPIEEIINDRKSKTPFLDWYKGHVKNPIEIIDEPIQTSEEKTKTETIQEIIEPNPERLEKIRKWLGVPLKPEMKQGLTLFSNLEEIYAENKIEHAKREMQELDNFTKIVDESETVKDLVKSLDKSIIPFWLKFGAFLLGLVIGAFYAFPDIQIPLLETINLVNNSPYLVIVMSFVPIMFLLAILKKFDRGMF